VLSSDVAAVSEEATDNIEVMGRNGGQVQIFVGVRSEKKHFEEIKRREFGREVYGGGGMKIG
jgi:phosphotransferase system IIB component